MKAEEARKLTEDSLPNEMLALYLRIKDAAQRGLSKIQILSDNISDKAREILLNEGYIIRTGFIGVCEDSIEIAW